MYSGWPLFFQKFLRLSQKLGSNKNLYYHVVYVNLWPGLPDMANNIFLISQNNRAE